MGALQDGRHPHDMRDDPGTRLDDTSGPEGCILCSPNTPQAQDVAQVQLAGSKLPVQLPPFWPLSGTVGIHKSCLTSLSLDASAGIQNDSLYRRLMSGHKLRRGDKSVGPDNAQIFREPGIYYKLPKIDYETHTGDRIPGVCGECEAHEDDITPTKLCRIKREAQSLL